VKDNVFITVWKGSQVITRYSGHNVWVDRGREYMADMLQLQSHDPDIPGRRARVKYVGFGIGGIGQTDASAGSPPFSTYYPTGGTRPTGTGTTGATYRTEVPIDPLIETLERPIMFTGVTTTGYYGGTNASDYWLSDPTPPNFLNTYPNPGEVSYRLFVNGATDLTWVGAPVPLSEVGLFLNEDSTMSPAPPPVDYVDTHQVWSPLVAYHTFGTILFDNTMKMELIWVVRFN